MSSLYVSKVNVNFGEVWEVRCEKWTCYVRCEKWSCDEFWCDKWGVRSGVRSGAVMSWDVIGCDEKLWCDKWGVRSGTVMSWDVISCDELWWVVMRSCDVISGAVMSGDDKSTTAEAGTGAAGSKWKTRARRMIHAATRLQYTYARRSSSRTLCVLRLPRERQPRPQRRPRAPQLLQEALCTAPATRKAAADHARRRSARRLCVLRLARERQPRPQRRPRAPQLLQEALCTAPAMRKAAAAPAATTRAAAPPGGSVYCACHKTKAAAKGSRGPSGDHARRSSSRRLCCVLHLPRERQPRPQRRPRERQPRPQRRPRAPQQALCTAPATRKAAAAPAATMRAAAPPGGSVYLCVLRLARERQPRPQRRPRAPQLLQEALCTAPATRKAARKLSVLRLPEWVSGWVSEWVTEWVSEWSEWVSEVSEWVSEVSEVSGVEWSGVELSEWSEWVEWVSGVSEWEWVSELSELTGGGRGRGGGSPGGMQAKNKNPTQWCGEQEPHTVMWGKKL